MKAIKVFNPKIRKTLKELARLSSIKTKKKGVTKADLKSAFRQKKEGKTKPLNTLWD